jgi:hypothetical protein
MLNSVLYAGFRSLIRNVDCDQALEITISIVGAGPRISSAVKSTAYESEMQELPAPSGMSTFRTELMTDSTRNAAKSPGRGNCSDVKALAITTAPRTIRRIRTPGREEDESQKHPRCIHKC